MIRIEVHRKGREPQVGELTTDHAASSHDQPVFVSDDQVYGVGDLVGAEIRVRDPKALAQVEDWLSAWPQFRGSVRVSHGGPRGGPRKWKDTVRRPINFEREQWASLQDRAKAEGRSAPEIIAEALAHYLGRD